MKKILLFAAMVFSFGVNANTLTITIKNSLSEKTLQEKTYTLIEVSSIPSDVLKNISLKYGGFTIKESHAATDGEYKLILSKDEKTVIAYFTAKGEFIKEA